MFDEWDDTNESEEYTGMNETNDSGRYSDEYTGMNETNDSGRYSLESILAEIKGSAFINGDKKTPPDLLQEKADRILREAAEMSAASNLNNEKPRQVNPAPRTITSATHLTSSEEKQTDFGEPSEAYFNNEPEFSETDEIPMLITPEENEFPRPLREQTPAENQVLFFDQFRAETPQNNAQDTQVRLISDKILGEDEFDEPQEEIEQKQRKLFSRRNRSSLFDQETLFDESEPTSSIPFEEEVFDEPDLRRSVRKFASECNSAALRVMPASVISILMIFITYVYEAGMIVPFGIGYTLEYAAGALVICLLIVMMLCSDVIVRGVDFLIKGVPNAETLILFSCAFSLISPIFSILSGAAHMLPFCAVSALSLTFAAHGEKFNLRAITDTLKTAVGSSEPYGVQAEYNSDIDNSVLKKAYNRTDGFYNNLMQPDITELTYRYAAPALLIAALVLTVLLVLIRGGAENSLHILSALLAAAAPFSILLSFSVPFITVARAARKSGAAVAGWGGADDICFNDGVCVMDDDLFPPGTLKLSGVKVYDGASPESAIRYTASIIMASGSGLTSLFAEVLKQQGLSAVRVDNFECRESGIAGLVHGEQVSTGSAAFMNLLGVRVPDDSTMKNAVYTAVNNRLTAMFAIDYKPLPSVQSALISMLKWRIDLYFAMRDFNVTPAMVGQKFKVPFDSFVFIPAKNSYSISDRYSRKPGRMAAVLIREGFNPFAEAITSGRLLKSAAFFATILSVVSAALGVLIMFYMCWTGSFLSASPGNLIIFMLCMLATVLIVCGYVRLKK